MASPREAPLMAVPRSVVVVAAAPSSSSPAAPSGVDRGQPTSSSPDRKQLQAAPSSLVQPGRKKRRGLRSFRLLRSAFRTLPAFNPAGCGKHHASPTIAPGISRRGASSGTRVTGTLFGYRKGRVSLSLQEASGCLPTLVVELAIQTQVLLQEMSSGMMRIALECEKRPPPVDGGAAGGKGARRCELLEEPLWTVFCNGRKTGYGVRREATEDDIHVMELLRPVSVGAGVLPGKSSAAAPAEGAGEVAYMRSSFEHVVGSRDSETLYMISPEGNNGPDLTVFFVRI